jgi:prepilin-type N-terminal cleavage/methylation domain-containing protein
MMTGKRFEYGFTQGLTLIELLVALVILATLGIMSWRGIDSALRSRDQIVEVEQRWQKLSRGFSLIEHNLLQAAERGSSLPGAFPDFKLEKLPDGRQRLIFWRMDPVQGSRLTGFRLDENKLMLLRWPHNVPLVSTSNSSSNTSSSVSPSMSLDLSSNSTLTTDAGVDADSILTGVSNVRWAVLTSDRQWLDIWPPAAKAGLPRGVRIDMDIDNVGHIQRLFALR